MTTIRQPICFDCKHFDIEKMNCTAFPEGLPDVVIMGDNKHTKPLRRQKNKIVFEPIEQEKKMKLHS